MKKILRLVLLTVYHLPLITAVYAGNPGTTGANFLKIGAGVRNIAMGESSAATSNDVNSVYWNPAGLSQMEYQEATFMYNKWFEEIDQQFFGYAYPNKKLGTFGLGVYRVGMESVQGYDANGIKTDEVNAGDMAAGLSYARRFASPSESNIYRIGITGKWIQEKLDDVTASTFAGDVGLQYSGFPFFGDWAEDLTFGAAVTNVGGKLKFDRDETKLPQTIKAGFGYIKEILGDPLTVGVDVYNPSDNEISIGGGVEYWLKDLLALRVGYKTKDDEGSGVRAGAGIKVKMIRIDYAYAGYGILGDTHRIGLSVSFGAPIEKLVPEAKDAKAEFIRNTMSAGMKLYESGRYVEAALEFNKVLDKDPGHQQALEMMKKSNQMFRK